MGGTWQMVFNKSTPYGRHKNFNSGDKNNNCNIRYILCKWRNEATKRTQALLLNSGKHFFVHVNGEARAHTQERSYNNAPLQGKFSIYSLFVLVFTGFLLVSFGNSFFSERVKEKKRTSPTFSLLHLWHRGAYIWHTCFKKAKQFAYMRMVVCARHNTMALWNKSKNKSRCKMIALGWALFYFFPAFFSPLCVEFVSLFSLLHIA